MSEAAPNGCKCGACCASTCICTDARWPSSRDFARVLELEAQVAQLQRTLDQENGDVPYGN